MLLPESFLVVRRVEVGDPGKESVAADSSDGKEVRRRRGSANQLAPVKQRYL